VIFNSYQCANGRTETLDDFPAAQLPIRRLKDDKEIIATDMPDKINALIKRPSS
jgi:hypothetical protein